MQADIEQLADELVSVSLHASPPSALLLGLDDIEGDLEDLSKRAQSELAAKYASITTRAQAIQANDAASLADRDQLALDHLVFTAGKLAKRQQLPHVEFTISNYPASPLSGLLSLLPQLPVATPERQDRYSACLSAIPRYLDQAVVRHREGLATGLTPTRRGVGNAVRQIDTIVKDPTHGGLLRELTDGGSAFSAAQERIFSSAVIPAVRHYRTMLAEEMAPQGRSDEECGLSWLPDGAALYRQWAHHYTWSDGTPEQIHELGLSRIATLQTEMAEVGERVWGISEYAAVRERLLSDPALRFTSSEEILSTAIAAVRHAEAAAPDWFALVPSTPCAVSPIPDALADGAAVAYYYGGALDGSRPGTYFVNTTKAQQRDRHTAESIAYHEAVPGHHFQLTIAQEMANSHLLFRVTRDVANAEGWGLYSERLADEMGLYTSDVSRLGMMTTDAMRAARLVVDTGLHALQWSRQRAIDWMVANVPMTPIEITQEIDRYIMIPGQALSYMHGRIEIEACRSRAAAELGASFDLRQFHDMVLATGPVALPAFSAAVRRWIATNQN